MWGIRVPPVFDPQIIPKKARKEIWTGPSKKMKRCHCHQCWRSSHQEQRYFQLKVFETTNDWVVLEITKHRRVAITPVTQIRCEWPPMAKVAKGQRVWHGMADKSTVLETSTSQLHIHHVQQFSWRPQGFGSGSRWSFRSPSALTTRWSPCCVQAQFHPLLEYDAVLRQLFSWNTS